MSNSLNWSGNKGLDPNAPSRGSRSVYSMPTDAGSSHFPSTGPYSSSFLDPMTPSPATPGPATPGPITSRQPSPSAMPAPSTPITPGPMTPMTPMEPGTTQGPPPSTEPGYIPNYLRRNIGKTVRAEFIVGTNQFVDRVGVIKEVGINYFVLRDLTFNNDVMCDLYSVKFVTSIS
jgi:hypothetical protein